MSEIRNKFQAKKTNFAIIFYSFYLLFYFFCRVTTWNRCLSKYLMEK